LPRPLAPPPKPSALAAEAEAAAAEAEARRQLEIDRMAEAQRRAQAEREAAEAAREGRGRTTRRSRTTCRGRTRAEAERLAAEAAAAKAEAERLAEEKRLAAEAGGPRRGATSDPRRSAPSTNAARGPRPSVVPRSSVARRRSAKPTPRPPSSGSGGSKRRPARWPRSRSVVSSRSLPKRASSRRPGGWPRRSSAGSPRKRRSARVRAICCHPGLGAARARGRSLCPRHPRRVRQFWVRPPATGRDLATVVSVRLIPGGEVVPNSVRVVQSSGNTAFDQSVVAAVNQASPLPVPSGPVFERFSRVQFHLQALARTDPYAPTTAPPLDPHGLCRLISDSGSDSGPGPRRRV
jgi:colicin import membrane protein